MIKQVHIYAPVHVFKILLRDYDYRDKLYLGKHYHIISPTNYQRCKKWMEPQEGSRRITIEGLDMNPFKAYAIIRSIDKQFREKMNTYVLGQVNAGRAARTAVLEFLELYDILEEEIKLDSAYKDWRRFMATNKKRSRIPLWV
ncbi:hypothetical protein PBT90_00020 [Algoriphagus halophytocola]|uniref:hypothetical protein n=1 Tax=Algoriphagus halophytocola TaxID=2991499 RepID=UPI0022DD6B39|nr:hypothetical protein [Algoriphagus sp. TR-M9]WBL42370.1 hypothetical protein PBT90_16665 [Algoriphagus sp. TR-M9]WBL43093.1 hypothetical protein PBT90_00020 [Algoriphagus sp. TR-M9]